MQQFVLCGLYALIAANEFVQALPMYGGNESPSDQDRMQHNVFDPWQQSEHFSTVPMEGQTSHQYDQHEPQTHQYDQDDILNHFQTLGMSTLHAYPHFQSNANVPHYGHADQYEMDSHFPYGTTANLPQVPYSDMHGNQYESNIPYSFYPDNTVGNIHYGSTSADSSFPNTFNPLDASLLGGGSSFSSQIWDEIDHTTPPPVRDNQTTNQPDRMQKMTSQQDKTLQALQQHFDSPDLHGTLAHLSRLIPENNVFDVHEIYRDLTPEELKSAQLVARQNPPGSLNSRQRSLQRLTLSRKGFPIAFRSNKNMEDLDEETKKKRLEAYKLTLKTKRLQKELAKEVEKGEEEMSRESEGEDSIDSHRLGPPPFGLSKEAYRHLYIPQEDIDKLNDQQRAELHAFYVDWPLTEKLPAVHTHYRHRFNQDRTRLQNMGIPLPSYRGGRPRAQVDEEEAEQRKEKRKQKGREYMAAKRAAQKEKQGQQQQQAKQME